MLKLITINILKVLDSYNNKKLFKFLKKKNIDKFDTFFDVGAHKGESINLFSKNFNINKIYSFEPSILNFNILKKNKEKLQKKFGNLEIIIENYALGNANEKKLIKHLSESSSSTINSINEKSKYFKRKFKFLNFFNNENFFSELEIEQIKLEDYMKKEKIDKIDFLKIDTEGYEYQVLQGLGQNISKVKLIMFEHHYHDMLLKNYTFTDIHNLLIKNKFKQIFKYKMALRKTFEYIYINH